MKLLDHIKVEHKALLPHVYKLKSAADSVGLVDESDLWPMLTDSLRFLTEQLVPHAKEEEEILYALVAKYAGTDAGVELMTRDHAEVGRLTTRLGELISDKGDDNDLRDTLYSLHSLVVLHFKKEEEFMLPVLEQHLTEEDDEHAAHHLHSH